MDPDFPYVLIHAVNGMHDAAFNHLSPYFLTSIGSLLLIFFIMNVICRVYVGRKLATLICLGVVCFFSFSAFVFITHYEFMGIMMSAREIFFALADPMHWFHRILLHHIGVPRLLAMTVGQVIYVILYAKWIYKSAYHLDPKWIRKSGNPIPLFTGSCSSSYFWLSLAPDPLDYGMLPASRL